MATTQPTGLMAGAIQPLTTEQPATNDLQNQTFPTSPATASTAGATGYTATQRTVDPAKETVQGQFTGLMASDNPLIQMARTNAKQTMNDRGLLNSSMALQAGDVAAYQAALPIANADAQTYSTAAGQNAQYENAADQFGATAKNSTSQFNAGEQNKLAMQAFDSNTKIKLGNIEAGYKTLMQANASAGDYYKQIVKNMTDVMMNKDMGDTAKQTAIDNQVEMLKSGLGVIGAIGNLNLSGLLDFSSLPGGGGSPAEQDTQSDTTSNTTSDSANTNLSPWHGDKAPLG